MSNVCMYKSISFFKWKSQGSYLISYIHYFVPSAQNSTCDIVVHNRVVCMNKYNVKILSIYDDANIFTAEVLIMDDIYKGSNLL